MSNPIRKVFTTPDVSTDFRKAIRCLTPLSTANLVMSAEKTANLLSINDLIKEIGIHNPDLIITHDENTALFLRRACVDIKIILLDPGSRDCVRHFLSNGLIISYFLQSRHMFFEMN